MNKRVHSCLVRVHGDPGRISCVESVHGLDPCAGRARGKLTVTTEDFKGTKMSTFTQCVAMCGALCGDVSCDVCGDVQLDFRRCMRGPEP